MGYRNFCQVIKRVGTIADFRLKYGKGFGKRAAHPHPIFLGEPPLDCGTLKIYHGHKL